MRSDRYKQETQKKKSSALKVLLILILLLIVAIGGSTAYFYKSALDSLAINFKDGSDALKFGGDYPAMDQIESSEGDVTPASEKLDADSTGEHEMSYTVSKSLLGGLLEPSREFTLQYTVVDTEAPLMLWSGDGTVLEAGTGFDINNVIAYGDNADPEPSVTVDGEVDMNTEGSYPLHVTVTDASGNSTDWDLSVEVATELPTYEDNSERTKFEDFVSEYKGDGKVFGIDVSAWQDEIDFEAVKKAGCEFVMIRIGFGSGDDYTLDKRFRENLEHAKAAGIRTGLYFYSYDNSVDSVRKSAQHIIETLDGTALELPVAFDWEDFTAFQTYKMNFTELNRMYDAFADELAKSGYDCMLYGSKTYLEKVWTGTDTRPVWLAHYIKKTDYDGPYVMWQAGCTGRISGIDGDVDLDILYEKDQ